MGKTKNLLKKAYNPSKTAQAIWRYVFYTIYLIIKKIWQKVPPPLLILTYGFSKQIFLGQPWISLLFKVAPKVYRKNLALRILGISPHYFIYQRGYRKYPSTMSRIEILKTEYKRNISSRKKICEQILKPYLKPSMVVLDFGCGPGYLALEVAKQSRLVFAVDISCGVIACAKYLNPAYNILYLANNRNDLSMLGDSSVDLIYSFAVVQHLSEKLFEKYLREFFRVLKPKGKIVCHIAIDNNTPDINDIEYRKIFELYFTFRSSENVRQRITNAEFREPMIIPIKQISDVEDDIIEQHLFVFDKAI